MLRPYLFSDAASPVVRLLMLHLLVMDAAQSVVRLLTLRPT